jgi:hypothetical protein
MRRAPRAHMRCYYAGIQYYQMNLARSREESSCLNSVAHALLCNHCAHRCFFCDVEPEAILIALYLGHSGCCHQPLYLARERDAAINNAERKELSCRVGCRQRSRISTSVALGPRTLTAAQEARDWGSDWMEWNEMSPHFAQLPKSVIARVHLRLSITRSVSLA